jgi:hypothetical protein
MGVMTKISVRAHSAHMQENKELLDLQGIGMICSLLINYHKNLRNRNKSINQGKKPKSFPVQQKRLGSCCQRPDIGRI